MTKPPRPDPGTVDPTVPERRDEPRPSSPIPERIPVQEVSHRSWRSRRRLDYYHLLHKLDRIEGTIMALADVLATLQAEDAELASDVADLAAAITNQTASITALQTQVADLVAAGSATPEQLAALQVVADDLAATHAAAEAALPPAP